MAVSTICGAGLKPALRRNPFGRYHVGNFQADNGAKVRHTANPYAVRGAVNDAEALVHIAQAYAVGQRRAHPLIAHAHSVIFDFDNRVAVLAQAAESNAAAANLP